MQGYNQIQSIGRKIIQNIQLYAYVEAEEMLHRWRMYI